MKTKDLDERILTTAIAEVNRMASFKPLEYGHLKGFVDEKLANESNGKNVKISNGSTVDRECLEFVSNNISSILAIYLCALKDRETGYKFNQLQSNILTALDRALNGEPDYHQY
jgi:hypothetical protein